MKPGGTCWDETRCSVNVWNLIQTRVKPVLLVSVERALGGPLASKMLCFMFAIIELKQFMYENIPGIP